MTAQKEHIVDLGKTFTPPVTLSKQIDKWLDEGRIIVLYKNSKGEIIPEVTQPRDEVV